MPFSQPENVVSNETSFVSFLTSSHIPWANIQVTPVQWLLQVKLVRLDRLPLVVEVLNSLSHQGCSVPHHVPARGTPLSSCSSPTWSPPCQYSPFRCSLSRPRRAPRCPSSPPHQTASHHSHLSSIWPHSLAWQASQTVSPL